MERVRLNNGIEMPLVGLGTFKLRGYDIVYQALDAALAHGYRSFDTASVYQNEVDIGKALKDLLPKHGLSRQDLFITSKLAPKDHGREAEAGCLRSLEALDCEYLDLYLIHWPGKQGHKSEDSQNPAWRQESWETMERLYGSGSFRAIGVSNYTVGHLQELLARCHVKPAVLQVEYHPHLVQEELLAYCLANGIHLQAYSSLGTGYLITEPKVEALATKYGKTPAQVLLQWALQQGIGVIPKSSNPERIAQNIQLFDFSLGEEDMEVLNGMHSDTRYCWDPRHVV